LRRPSRPRRCGALAAAFTALFLATTASLRTSDKKADDGKGRPPGYETRVVVRDLERPTGIVAQGSGVLYITQLPTPGMGGMAGGRNTVDKINLYAGRITNLTTGEPEPTNLALDRHGNLYWTCKSAGVILERSRRGEVSVFLRDLTQPSGIAVDRCDGCDRGIERFDLLDVQQRWRDCSGPAAPRLGGLIFPGCHRFAVAGAGLAPAPPPATFRRSR